MIAPARRAAFDALAALDAGTMTLPDALARMRPGLQDPRDVALASEIVIGTTRWRAAIDFLIAGASSRPIETVDAAVLRVLRLSAYQLLYLDRVPASAAVNEAVVLVRQHAPAAAGFANAVLRRLADGSRRPALPPRPATGRPTDEWIPYLSVVWSHPAWLVERWVSRVGLEATEARLRHGQAAPRMTVRPVPVHGDLEALRARLGAEGVEATPARFAPGALEVRAGNPVATVAAREGALFVQDEGSQLVALYADTGDAIRVLDTCAAPGGKATAIAGAGPAGRVVVAGDARRRRVALLRETLRGTGASNVLVLSHDAARLPFRDVFDLVLVDAPCSGLGTLRRDPDLKWVRRASDLPRFAARQRAMLAEAARVTAPGGRLVYATCSSEPEENEAVAAWLLASVPGFSRATPPAAFAEAPLAAVVAGDGTLVTSPERHGLDMYFAAAFVRAS